MKKKGFTLMELLAVIAILALIVLLLLPNIMKLFKSAKQKSFESELKEIYKQANNQWAVDSIYHGNKMVYARTATSSCEKELKLDGRKDLAYYIEIDKDGNVVKFYATDGSYQYGYKGSGLKVTQIKDATDARESNRKVKITCTTANQQNTPPASTNDYLMTASSTLSNENYLRTSLKKNQIEKITIADSIDGHSANGTNCWDVSKGNNGSVLAWATDLDNNGLYELTIGANGAVFASSGAYLFYYMTSLKSLESLDLLDMSQATSMYRMFSDTRELTSLDVSSFDTSKVTNMSWTFANSCGHFILDLSSWNTSKVQDFSHMFQYTILYGVNLNGWDTSSATNMSCMFNGCISFETINVSSFDTSKVTNMSDMFNSMQNLKSLDVSNFNTSKVTDMSGMFMQDDRIETLNLSNFDTSKVTNMSEMFKRSSSLKSIFVSNNFVTSAVNNSTNMFDESPSLKGGTGTTYNTSNPKDKTYAHIDGGTSNPGYFTRFDLDPE